MRQKLPLPQEKHNHWDKIEPERKLERLIFLFKSMLVFLQTSPEVFWFPRIVKGLQSCCAMHPRIHHWSVILQTFLHDCCKNGCCAFTQEAILSTEPIKTFLLSFSKKCSSACAGCTALYTTINPLHLCRAKNNTILIKLSPSPSSTPLLLLPRD